MFAYGVEMNRWSICYIINVLYIIYMMNEMYLEETVCIVMFVAYVPFLRKCVGVS